MGRRFIHVAAAVPKSQTPLHELAFERLYRRYVKDVYRYTLALLQNPADAEDVTQTTFLNAWGAYRRGVEPTKPHNWLIKIAHNAARTRYAVSARRPQEVAFDERVHELPVPPAEASELQGVLQALANLPFNQRSALVMRELEGRSYSEIAETLEVSVSAVETLIFRARKSLRLNRAKLHALGAIQLPPSLATFFESGGGAVVGGGVIVGSGLLAKAAVVIATGIVAGGVGYSAVHAADQGSSSRAIAGGLGSQGPLPVNGLSPVGRLVSRAPEVRHTVGHVAPASPPYVHTIGGATADGAPPTAPVDRAGSPTPAASTVTSTTSIVTSVVTQVPQVPEVLQVPQLPPAPAVSSPIELPPIMPLPLVPPLPQPDPPPLPKLP